MYRHTIQPGNKMLKFFTCACLLAVAYGAAVPAGDVTIEEHIVGGKATNISEVPYQVVMYRSNRFMCGGSIVTPTHIVTAAHCVEGQSASYLTFRAGSSSIRTGGVVVQAKAIYAHPYYNPRSMDYDIAVVELTKPLTYGSNIKPIKLISSEPTSGNVKVSGWGLLRESGEEPTTLQSVVVPVVDRKTCTDNYADYVDISKRMICAGVEGKDSCQGDSGGPLNYNGVLAGVVSFGVGCARKNFPGVYTNVANPEINSFIKKHAGL